MAVIDVFGPDADNNGIADEIEAIKANGWMINEANLTFYIDRTAMANTGISEPNRIFLYDLNNKRPLVDYSFDFSSNATYPKFNKFVHGGIIEKEDVDNGRGIKYKVRITCPGDPRLAAEGLVLLDESWPDFMRGRWSIDKVMASGSRQQSYRCSIEATCLDARSEPGLASIDAVTR